MEKIKHDIQTIVETLGYIFYDMTFGKREGDFILSIEIDHEKGIDIEDCVTVSERISDYLDETDPIEQSYGLEVTSAGAERPLRNEDEIHRAVGKFIHVQTMDQTFQGHLESTDDISVTIKEKNNKMTTILKTDIQTIRLAINF